MDMLARPMPEMRLTRWLFLRGLSAVYLAAFLSLWSQAAGLFGDDGILPLGQRAGQLSRVLGQRAPQLCPSLLWLSPDSHGLHAVCAAGTAAALFAGCGLGQVLSLFACWACYLSLVSFGEPFLSFQWDSLLLEAGFLGILLAPWKAWSKLPSADPAVPALPLWLSRWLLFRLMLFSGLVKMASGDLAWRDLSAMSYHYWTQPLPPWTAYYFAHLPDWWHRGETLLTLAVELFAPWLILAGRKGRQVAFWSFLLLMAGIQLTGNYGFFNLLTAVLCLSLVDDRFWSKRPGTLETADDPPAGAMGPVRLAGAALVALLSLSSIFEAFGISSPIEPIGRALRPYQLVSSYGLFAVMTRSRPQLVIEGSRDGTTWVPYTLPYQAGPLKARPRYAPLHMPRLDWQLWFAAMDSPQRNPWLLRTVRGLLQGSPEVLALFAADPFAGQPPKAVRISLYDYRFSDGGKNWWTRRYEQLYLPPMTLSDFVRQ
jgi:hypothetical protein